MRAHNAQKNALKPWQRKQWVIPPPSLPQEANADFVCAMEDVLEVYPRPYDPARPVVRSASHWWLKPARRCRSSLASPSG
jgi:hypothetical protein